MSQNDLDLLDLAHKLYRYKKFIVLFVFLSLAGCFLYNQVCPKKYDVSATFFIPLESNSSGLSGTLLGYASALGASLPTNLGDYIFSIVESGTIQKSVASALQDRFAGESLSDVMTRLRLSKNVILKKNKNGLFRLTFRYTDPEIALKTVQLYLDQIAKMNQDLRVSTQREIITVLDPPQLPNKPSRPRKLMNLFVTLFFSFFASASAALIFDQTKERRNFR